MNKTSFLKAGAVLFLLAILFTPEKTDTWKYLFISGILMGIWWFTRT